ncbi:MAG: isoprenylcysteine carboxylmethyltransferase family protein [Pirellulales bacterium]
MQLAIGLPAFFALFLFLPAGNWAWERGWRFVLAFTATMALAAVVLMVVNPEIYAARSHIHKGTKRWDRILLAFFFPAMIAIFPVAALDDGRFHWFAVPWSVVGLGYFLFLTGFAVTVWAQAVNQFFEPSVRIQTDRGHKVIDTGPYAVVRHPGYLAAMILFAGIALSLGSLWALIPAAISSGLLVLRTRWEDQTLQAELPGYKEYAQRVRFKLIPFVW